MAQIGIGLNISVFVNDVIPEDYETQDRKAKKQNRTPRIADRVGNQANLLHFRSRKKSVLDIPSLKELARSYLTLAQDVTRAMNRIKALYRSWAIPCSGTKVYAPHRRAEWLAKIAEPGVRVLAQRLYQQLDGLQPGRLQARLELLRRATRILP